MANEIGYDKLFELMSSPRRRCAIRMLLEQHEVEFSDLVDRVAENDYGKPIEEIPSDDRHTVYVSLKQTHIDALTDLGVFEYNEDTDTVSLGPNAGEVVKWVPRTEDSENPPGDDISKAEVMELIGDWKDGFKEGFVEGLQHEPQGGGASSTNGRDDGFSAGSF